MRVAEAVFLLYRIIETLSSIINNILKKISKKARVFSIYTNQGDSLV